MEPQHTVDLLRHLEKQNELLKEARRTMQQELQKLEVEEHMLMDKLYALMVTRRLTKKKMKEGQKVPASREPVEGITNGDE